MPTFSNDPYRNLPSLADNKSVDLARKYQEKSDKLNPQPVVPELSLAELRNQLTGTPSDTNELDLMEASGYRALGNLRDLGADASNRILGTNFNIDEDAGWSNPEIANSLAGVHPEYQAQLNQDQDKVLQSVAEGNYGDALINALKVSTRTAASSAATIPELALGALLTPVAGTGLAATGRKVKGMFDTGTKIKERYEDIKETTKAGKALKTAKNLAVGTAKNAGRASIITADLLQQQIQEYRAKNNGEDPSASRLATSALGILATTIADPYIVSKLFIGSWKNELVNEGKTLLENVGKEGSNFKQIGTRIGEAIKEIGKAGGAETVQEYAQTWQEMFATEISPEEADNVWKAVKDVIGEKKFRDLALTGGILGGTAGGVTRGAMSAPTVAAGTTADLTKATARGTVKTVAKGADKLRVYTQDKANKAGLKMFTEKEREVLRNEYNTKNTVVKQKSAAIDQSIDKVKKAETYENMVADEDLTATVKQAQAELHLTEDELTDPVKLDQLKDKATRIYKGQKTILKADLEASNIGRTFAHIGKKTGETAVKIAKDVIDTEQVKQIIETVKQYGEKTVESVKEIKSNAALGVIEIGLKSGKNSTKQVIKDSKNLELADLQRVAAVIKKKNPDLGKRLEKFAAQRKAELGRFGLYTDDVINKTTLKPEVKDIAKKGTLDSKDAASASLILQHTLAGRIADIETLNTIKKAVEVYKNSDAYKNQEAGINEVTMQELENRLSNAHSRLTRTDKILDKGKKVAKKAKEKAESIVKKVDDYAEDLADKIDQKLKPKSREKKVIPENALRAKLENTENVLKTDPTSATEIITQIGTIAQNLRDAGYTTEEDINDLLEQFPELANNEVFSTALTNEFTPTDAIVKEDINNKENTEDDPVSDNDLVNIYEDFNPGCKK